MHSPQSNETPTNDNDFLMNTGNSTLLTLPEEILHLILSHYYTSFELQLTRRPDRTVKLTTSPLNAILTCRQLSTIALQAMKQNLPTHLNGGHFYPDIRGYPAAFYASPKLTWLHHRLTSFSCSLTSSYPNPYYPDDWANLLHACPNLQTLNIRYTQTCTEIDLIAWAARDIPAHDVKCRAAIEEFINSGSLHRFVSVLEHWVTMLEHFEMLVVPEMREISNFMHTRNQWVWHHRELTGREKRHATKGVDRINVVWEVQLPSVGESSEVVLRSAWVLGGWEAREVWRELRYIQKRVVWTVQDESPEKRYQFATAALEGWDSVFWDVGERKSGLQNSSG